MKKFILQVVEEMKLVKWPQTKDVWAASALVITLSLTLGYFLTAVDTGFKEALRVILVK